jgi:hypothetical protein
MSPPLGGRPGPAPRAPSVNRVRLDAGRGAGGPRAMPGGALHRPLWRGIQSTRDARACSLRYIRWASRERALWRGLGTDRPARRQPATPDSDRPGTPCHGVKSGQHADGAIAVSLPKAAVTGPRSMRNSQSRHCQGCCRRSPRGRRFRD